MDSNSPFLLSHSALNSADGDRLGRDHHAKLLLRIIRESHTEGATIGLLGPWGVGKSSMRPLVEAAAEDEKVSLPIARVSAWRFARNCSTEQLIIDAVRAVRESYPELKPFPSQLNDSDLICALFGAPDVRADSTQMGTVHPDSQLNAPKDPWHKKWTKLFVGLMWTTIFLVVISLALLAISPFVPQTYAFGLSVAMLSLSSAAASVCAGAPNWLNTILLEVSKKSIADFLLSTGTQGTIRMPPSATRTPSRPAELLKALATHVAARGRLVVWLEDVDRCEPDIARETLASLRLLSRRSDTVFVVECDDDALSHRLENSLHEHDAHKLLQRAFDHTVNLPPPSQLTSMKLVREEGQRLGLPDATIEVVNAAAGENARRAKRILERVAHAHFLLKSKAAVGEFSDGLAENTAALAFIEVLRECAPGIWRRVTSDAYLLDSLVSNGLPLKASDHQDGSYSLPSTEVAFFNRIVDSGRVVAPALWAPLLRMQRLTDTELDDEVVGQLYMLVFRGTLAEAKLLIERAQTAKRCVLLQALRAWLREQSQTVRVRSLRLGLAISESLGDQANELRSAMLKFVQTSDFGDALNTLDEDELAKVLSLAASDDLSFSNATVWLVERATIAYFERVAAAKRSKDNEPKARAYAMKLRLSRSPVVAAILRKDSHDYLSNNGLGILELLKTASLHPHALDLVFDDKFTSRMVQEYLCVEWPADLGGTSRQAIWDEFFNGVVRFLSSASCDRLCRDLLQVAERSHPTVSLMPEEQRSQIVDRAAKRLKNAPIQILEHGPRHNLVQFFCGAASGIPTESIIRKAWQLARDDGTVRTVVEAVTRTLKSDSWHTLRAVLSESTEVGKLRDQPAVFSALIERVKSKSGVSKDDLLNLAHSAQMPSELPDEILQFARSNEIAELETLRQALQEWPTHLPTKAVRRAAASALNKADPASVSEKRLELAAAEFIEDDFDRRKFAEVLCAAMTTEGAVGTLSPGSALRIWKSAAQSGRDKETKLAAHVLFDARSKILNPPGGSTVAAFELFCELAWSADEVCKPELFTWFETLIKLPDADAQVLKRALVAAQAIGLLSDRLDTWRTRLRDALSNLAEAQPELSGPIADTTHALGVSSDSPSSDNVAA